MNLVKLLYVDITIMKKNSVSMIQFLSPSDGMSALHSSP